MDPIDGELRRALAVDPSPEFLARIRTRIAEEPAPRRRGMSWVVVAPAVFATALVVVAVWQRPRMHTPSASPAPLTARSIGATTPLSLPVVARSVQPAIVEPGTRATGTRRHGDGAAATAASSEPEVLIAADEARALRALISGVDEGRIVLTPVLTVVPGPSELLSVDEIAIEPITITPIAPVTGETGVRQ